MSRIGDDNTDVDEELANHLFALLADMPDEERYVIAEAYGVTPEECDHGIASWKARRL